jgi:hypothetical protein
MRKQLPADGAEPDRATEYERVRREQHLRSEGLDASADLARALMALLRAGIEVPTEILRAQQTVARYLDALEGATEGGEAIEEPKD